MDIAGILMIFVPVQSTQIALANGNKNGQNRCSIDGASSTKIIFCLFLYSHGLILIANSQIFFPFLLIHSINIYNEFNSTVIIGFACMVCDEQ